MNTLILCCNSDWFGPVTCPCSSSFIVCNNWLTCFLTLRPCRISSSLSFLFLPFLFLFLLPVPFLPLLRIPFLPLLFPSSLPPVSSFKKNMYWISNGRWETRCTLGMQCRVHWDVPAGVCSSEQRDWVKFWEHTEEREVFFCLCTLESFKSLILQKMCPEIAIYILPIKRERKAEQSEKRVGVCRASARFCKQSWFPGWAAPGMSGGVGPFWDVAWGKI